MKLVLSALTVMVASSVFSMNAEAAANSTSVVLATLTSDRDQLKDEIVLNFDDKGGIAAVAVITHFPTTPPTSQTKVFTVAQIGSAKGAVLDQEQGRDVIILKGRIDSKTGSEKLELKYLSNGLFGTYTTCPAGIRKSKDGEWQLINETSGRVADELFVQTYALGITTIKGICD